MKFWSLALLFILAACRTPAAPSTPLPVETQPPPTLAPPPIQIDFTRLRTFTHPSQQFAVSYPADWPLAEQPEGLIVADPTNQAGYSIFFSRAETALSTEELATLAMQFATENFGEEAGFEVLSQTESTVRFRRLDPTFGPALAELSLRQEGEVIFFVLLSIVEAQWTQTAPALQSLAQTLSIPQPVAATPAPVTGPPTWLVFAHPTERFAFLYPSNWELQESEAGAQSLWPDKRFTFTVTAVAPETLKADDDAAAALLNRQLAQLQETAFEFEARPIESYQTGLGSGYTVDYLYAGDDGLPMAGSIIVTQADARLYQITIAAPALVYEEALDWFNPMLQSFQLLPAEN